MTEESVKAIADQPTQWDWRIWLAKFRKPGPAQIGIMVGTAATVALLIALTLWSTTPAYEVLYHSLSETDAGQIMEALRKHNVPFKVDSHSGALTVPQNLVYEVRLKLASQGLPRGTVNGFEVLEQKTNFGISQFMETARYQHALEGELARSIMSIGAVLNARVHLALPKDTVFVRNRQPASASVLVQLHPGRVLDAGQVAAIVHLVSSSVPKLSADQVSVIDQGGNLLTRPQGDASLALSLDQLNYTRRLEESYIQRIEDILTPILGVDRVRAQVALDIDFTAVEETAENFDPRQSPGMTRSEQITEEVNGRPQPEGIPGALSNQPPGVATVPETVNPQNPQNAANNQTPGESSPTAIQTQTNVASGLRSRKEMTRNFELDKRVSHIRHSPGRIRRISTAVVLDDRLSLNQQGQPTRTPLSSEELERITALVKEAVAFDPARGDSVNVMNATFAASPFAEVSLPLWQQAWFLELVKWTVIALVALMVLLLVVRPLLRHWLAKPEAKLSESKEMTESLAKAREAMAVTDEEGLEGLLEDRVQLSASQPVPQLGNPLEQLEKRMQLAKNLVAEDPKRAVQVIKNWMVNEA
jgi:flagellar M-ring protein FliF